MPPKSRAKGARSASGSFRAGPSSPLPSVASDNSIGSTNSNGGSNGVAKRSKAKVAHAPLGGRPNSVLLLPVLVAFIALLGHITLRLHYALPTPLTMADSAASEAKGHGALFSEENAMTVLSKLVDIGYRIVGTPEHVEAEDWLEKQVRKYEGTHATGTGSGNQTQVEVWKQIGDGAHRFDFMSSVVWKRYHSMSNIIVRLSDGTNEGKEHAVLVNAHLDSTLPSPGAADDGAGIAILLEILRIYTTAPRPKLRHSVILLFNNGEESLQDASHLYATQHHTRDSVRAVVNLEACGTTGPELLFQATSLEMIKAYSKVPHPFGTVLANDVFSSGIILSDTDFRQFVEYGNQSGLDMAIIGNSYLYHTRKDIPANVEPGVLQHFGENTLAIVNYLVTSPESQLATNRAFTKSESPVYFSLMGQVFIYLDNVTFRKLVHGLVAVLAAQILYAVRAERHLDSLRATVIATLGIYANFIAGALLSNVVAFVLSTVLGAGMSWYRNEYFSFVVFGPPTVTGILIVQAFISSLFDTPAKKAYLERATLNGIAVFFIINSLVVNYLDIGSAYLFVLGLVTCILSIAVNDYVFVGTDRINKRQVAANNRVAAATYPLLSFLPTLFAFDGFTILDLFVPLTGRMGEISPVDHIIGSLTAILTVMGFPALIVIGHRYPSGFKWALMFTVSATVASVAVFSAASLPATLGLGPGRTFDEWHPKRNFVHLSTNLTSDKWELHFGTADPAPRFKEFVDEMQGLMGVPGEKAVLTRSDDKAAWAILHPVSDFLTPYSFQLPTPDVKKYPQQFTAPAPVKNHFRIRSLNEQLDLEAGTRRIKLIIDHPNLIWTVVSFHGEIIEWDLPTTPPKGWQKHYIKEVSRQGVSVWEINLLLKLDNAGVAAAKSRGQQKGEYGHLVRHLPGQEPDVARDPSRLHIEYSALDASGMWPSASKRFYAGDKDTLKKPSVSFFEKLDKYLLEKHPEMDSMLLPIIAAVAQV
ncbi:unnamed protein product [Tilletia controversa]|uniref:Peptide hydrolase n=1 Tax=Tilletia controversa TaxID=13291 RepID=A0A8X7MZS2_9BASI|nr:hypothetical protein CF328_g695 [Tilletia controversa]KAE8254721.1 hypothetical protein A4X06_0g768 [Tilletia controversa]CAD6900594.1 unnamed protein product [Tilletia controversa]CAD6927745.1 unnamed protein product [Tilletia controversa]CAD6929088.1 unnamed protein product [Tilletia controversa]